MAKRSLKGELVCNYLDEYPKVATKTLARKIYNENPEVYKDLDDCRSVIRYYRGNRGKANRDKIASKKHLRPNGKQFSWQKLPDGDIEVDWLNPTVIDCKRALILGDVHLPYHHKPALITALEHGYKNKCDVIYLNGDVFDAFMLSKFLKDPRQKDFPAEMRLTKEFLGHLRKEFKKARIYFKVGNHDHRYENYLKLKAPELLDIPEFSLSNILGLENLGIEVVGNKEWASINGLPVLHGHESGRSFYNPVNPARGAFLHMIHSCMVSHHHQSSSHHASDMMGQGIPIWSTGCLCNLFPYYMPVNKWNHGFAEIEGSVKSYLVHNYRIQDGMVHNA